MALNISAKATAPPQVNLSYYRLFRMSGFRTSLDYKAHIRDDLKAGGTFKTNFEVVFTPTGIKVNLTA